MFIVAELIKFLGAFLAASAAIAGAYLDGTKSIESGKLTRRGRIVVGSAITGVILSGSAQVAQMIDSRTSAEATRLRNEETASRLEQIPRLIARQSYPLEPLELFFSVEYPMDQPVLKAYSERLQEDIVQYLRNSRSVSKSTSDDLANEDIDFVISNAPEWLPTQAEQEQKAQALVEDNTAFVFLNPDQTNTLELKFLSTSAGIQDVIVTMPKRGDIKQHIELQADYKRRVFIKAVRCENPVRTGSDITSFSALDLVGRTVSWQDGVVTNLKWTLASLALRFSYDYGFGQNFNQLPAGRDIAITPSGSVITAQNVGLDFLFKKAGQ
ncbi:hypothetical protein FJ420_31055 [Mesorhizobium sp. B3-1-3]|uniref:hypothetical protein n=1 Tax=unclassified Mesorhizobium TaxID=325217 RepID=UPI00112EA207|nr:MULTISPECIES: hypothetical protein [unclassified Mesorhizobium]TPI60958.1 hypothetical protein FJ420_31055 [Mesorhizobium sp. B3-1-3]TPI67972.1 hypothetical protein FJ424_08390 [Mesorhizobium sp. B3-1-8]